MDAKIGAIPGNFLAATTFAVIVLQSVTALPPAEARRAPGSLVVACPVGATRIATTTEMRMYPTGPRRLPRGFRWAPDVWFMGLLPDRVSPTRPLDVRLQWAQGRGSQDHGGAGSARGVHSLDVAANGHAPTSNRPAGPSSGRTPARPVHLEEEIAQWRDTEFGRTGARGSRSSGARSRSGSGIWPPNSRISTSAPLSFRGG